MDGDGSFAIGKAMVRDLLALAEGTEAPERGPAALTTMIEGAGADLPAAKRARLQQQAEIARDFVAACRGFDRARSAGDAAAMDRQRAEMDRLRAAAAETATFLDFTYAAEQLVKATGFDDFVALLPMVALDRLYGTGRRISRFPLIWALSARDRPLERVQAMLAAGARVDLATRMGETVLHEMAAMNRTAAVRLPILRLLLFKGADLEAATLHGHTALSVAIERGSVADVGNFLQLGARLARRDLEQATHTPAKLAVIRDHLADDPEGLAALAALGGWLRGEIAGWRQRGAEAVAGGAKGEWHAKVTADLETSLEMVSALPGYLPAETQAKVAWQDEPAAFTAVETAPTLDAYRSALARVAISTYGIRDGERMIRGDHPIYWPIRAKADRLERLWLMLSAGAAVIGAPGNGEALHIFAGERRKDADEQLALARMLVQSGAKLEAVQYDGNTPLAVAVAGRGRAETAALLALGANPDVEIGWKTLTGPRFRAPLLFAAAEDAQVFKLLLAHGADTARHDSQGRTLAAYLAETRDELAALLAGEELSGNLTRHITRSRNAINRCLTLLGTAGG